MTFAATVPYALLILFGAALVVAAFNAKRLVRWENRALTSLADVVQNYRETLEEEQLLLAGAAPTGVGEPLEMHTMQDDRSQAA